MCMRVLTAYMCKHYMCVVHTGTRRECRVPRTGLINSCVPLCLLRTEPMSFERAPSAFYHKSSVCHESNLTGRSLLSFAESGDLPNQRPQTN